MLSTATSQPVLHAAEKILEKRIRSIVQLPAGEQALKVDEVASEGFWETVEASIDLKMKYYENAQAIARTSVWFSLRLALRGYRVAVGASLLLIAAVAGFRPGALSRRFPGPTHAGLSGPGRRYSQC